jgi:hypothetical protein
MDEGWGKTSEERGLVHEEANIRKAQGTRYKAQARNKIQDSRCKV